MKKEQYIEAEVEIIMLDTADIVCDSPEQPDDDEGEG